MGVGLGKALLHSRFCAMIGDDNLTRWTVFRKLGCISRGREFVADLIVKGGGDRIGFRRIEVRGHEVWLNGQPVFLRGISLHEQGPLRTGRSCIMRSRPRSRS